MTLNAELTGKLMLRARNSQISQRHLGARRQTVAFLYLAAIREVDKLGHVRRDRLWFAQRQESRLKLRRSSTRLAAPKVCVQPLC